MNTSLDLDCELSAFLVPSPQPYTLVHALVIFQNAT